MLGQSLQSLLNTYSGKTPTDFSDRFPGMRTKYAPGVRLPLSFIQKQKLGRSCRNPSPSYMCGTCGGLYRSLSPGSTTSPVHLTPLSKEEADVLQSRGSEPESHPGLNTQYAPVQGSQSTPRWEGLQDPASYYLRCLRILAFRCFKSYNALGYNSKFHIEC